MNTTLSPQALVAEAKDAYQRQAYDEAARQFVAAADAFQAQGDALQAAEMRNNAAVAWVQAGNPQEALALVEGTPDLFAQAGDVRRAGLAWGNLGSALEGLKRWAEAAEAYRQAAALLAQAGDQEARAAVLQSLSAVQLRLNDPVEALISMQDAVQEQPPSLKKRLLRMLLRWPLRLWRR